MSDADLTVVSHEQGDRILSGVGVSAHDLAETMDRHTPDEQQRDPETPTAVPADPAVLTSPEPAVAPPAPVGPDKPLTRGQKRFADLTREREEAKREAAALRAEVEALKARPSSPPPPAPPAPASAAAPEPAKTATPTRPKPTEAEIGTKYETYADFVEDLADWKSDQRLAALDFDARIRASIDADRASRSFQDTVTSVLAAGRKAFPDFDAVRAASDVPFPTALLETILAMEQPEYVIYRLAKDRDLAQRIATSDPYTAGLLLAGLRPSPDVRPASSGTPTVSPPPAPYQPVAGGRPTTVTPSAERAKGGFDYDKSGYREARAAERKSRRS